ncbi:MAG: beta-glucosidase, partial [Alphaproteobacteria bacterium]|nr:beta-glucosidase [Alphaproteobacteria bacterium]
RNGRAMALEGAVRDAPAILVTWFLGSETGRAVADILFGDYSPSGRLPVSFPIESGQEPYHYDHKPTGRPNPPGDAPQDYKAHFRGILNRALYPFGHGLTYGRILYSDLSADPRMDWDGPLSVSATIANQGDRSVEEVVQLYIRDRAASITRPVRELKDFRKIRLAPRSSQVVRFTLRRSDLLFVGRALGPVVEPGTFDLWIAPSSEADGVHGAFDLVR